MMRPTARETHRATGRDADRGRGRDASSGEAAWRRRFRAARVGLPSWARDKPTRALYPSNVSGKWELYAWDLVANEHRQVTDRPEGTVSGTVEPSGDRIWWFDDEAGDERGWWVSEPFAPARDPAEPVAPSLPKAYSAGLAVADDLAVIGRSIEDRTTLHVVRSGGEPELIYEHEEDAGVGGLSRDATLLCISHSEHGDARHPALRVVDLSGETVAELWDGEGRGLHPLGWSRVPGDQRLLVLHERSEMARPMVWDPVEGVETRLDVDLPGEVTASWCPGGEAVVLVHDHRGRSDLHRYDLDGGVLERLATEVGSVGGARVRPDGEVWYSWSSAASPPVVRRVDGDGDGDESVLLEPPGEPAPPGVPYEDLDVEGIHGFVARPEGEAPFPTAFLVHGGPESHDEDRFAPEPQAFVDHGFAVVLVNYRGSSGYGKAWRDALEGETGPGLTELEDLARVHDWALGSGLADPARVVLAGHSWGGYLTLLGLGRQPERWGLGIAGVPVADYVAAYEDEMEPLKAFDRALFGGAPEEVRERYVERSPITYVESVRAPVLVLAGENDPRCPIRQVDHYLARLDESGVPHDVYRYEAGHGSLVVDERVRQVEVMLEFAARHLGTPPPE